MNIFGTIEITPAIAAAAAETVAFIASRRAIDWDTYRTYDDIRRTGRPVPTTEYDIVDGNGIFVEHVVETAMGTSYRR